MSHLMYLTINFLFLFISYVDSCKWSPTQCGCAQTPPSIHNRIVGGTAAIPHSWPVSLQNKIHKHIVVLLFQWTVSVFPPGSLCGKN